MGESLLNKVLDYLNGKKINLMAKTKFLSKAATFMLNAGDLELSSYFIRKLQENKIKSEKNTNGGQVALTPNRTPSKRVNRDKRIQEKTGSEQFRSGFPGYFCHVCGKLQNPLLVKFRVRPRIRKRKQRKKSIETCCSSDDKQKKCKNRKNARKCPFVSSKCYFCNKIQKLVCHPPTVFEESQLNSSSRSKTDLSSSNVSSSNSPRKKKIQNAAGTPISSLGVSSRSSCSRKKRKSSNSTLAKLFSAKKKTPVSPNLKSFLFNS